MARFTGKTVLVTGSGRGIGRGIALRLAQEGANVIINDLKDDDNSTESVKEVQALGVKAVFIQADISKVDSVNALMASAVEQMGQVDVLVNNAGVELRAPFWEMTEQQYDIVMNVNLKGTFFLSQAFTKHLQATNRPGAIVNISSVHEELPFPNFTSYCTSKGGMKMLMRNLAVELGPLNIRVNNVAPGAIKTPINANLLSKPEMIQSLQRNISLGRLGDPEDVAAVVAFLASDDAKYVTGSTYYVDGGLTYHYTEQ
jgi:glucose 1-dehydrogenase